MAETGPVLLCAVAMTAFWSLLGLPVAVRIMPGPLRWLAAPALGWAIYCAPALILFSVIGMSRTVVTITSVLLAGLSAAMLRGQFTSLDRPPALLLAAAAMAACLALVPLFGVLPKFTAEGVVLAGPIFDHSKIALVDEIIRFGVPPANPFFSEAGTADTVSYYYVWHFSAGVIAVMTGVNGWTADAALTGFTAFSSLLLMMGFATWIGGRPSAGVLAIVLAASGNFRFILICLLGEDRSDELLQPATGFGAWLFQTSWAPQHVAAATSVVLACYLLTQIARRNMLALVALAFTAATAFESSIWVGGVTFALGAALIGAKVLWDADAKQRLSALGYAAAAAVIGIVLVLPILKLQYTASVSREIGFPIAITPVRVLGDWFSGEGWVLLDLPAYWLVYLPVEFPAFYVAGLMGLFFCWTRWRSPETRPAVQAFGLLTAVSLGSAWLLMSTVAFNNDLGWRAVIPGAIVLIVFAAVLLSRWWAMRRYAVLAAAGTAAALSLLDSAALLRSQIVAWPNAQAHAFAQAPRMWDAVRRQTGADERVANNPDDLAKITPWPVNISWALLANRRSCYAGKELAIPFAPLSQLRREQVDAQFLRVFAGEARPGDVSQLANQFRCDVIVITPRDGAWSRDPFGSSGEYRLVEERSGEWKIYRRAALR